MRNFITYLLQNHIGYLKLRDSFQRMYGELPTRRAKKKLKSVFHYLVNGDENTAYHFYKQLAAEYDKVDMS